MNFKILAIFCGLSLLVMIGCAVRTGVYHRVDSGETVWRIARVYDVDMDLLLSVNNIQDARNLRPGMMLLIPGASETREVPSYSQKRAESRSETTDKSGSEQSVRDNSEQPDPRVRRPKNSKVSGAENFYPVWPCKGRIVSRFDPSGDLTKQGLKMHVSPESDVKAMEDGEVKIAGILSDPPQLESYGNLIMISHGSDFVSVYAHLKDVLVKRGDHVDRGQIIAHAGKTGHVKQPVCYFEIRYKVEPRDPLLFLGEAA